ncbi:MAG: hypothetical protein KBD37_04215 [Burkholderiales bacterium]|nr:hypothetical protein [Burkholderiales bacterium]
MNIFILDSDIKKSAKYHVDKHCVKMILEHCQMLCTALTLNSSLQQKLDIIDIPYKKSHVNHPCTLWVSKNYDNFAWLVAYTHELHEEYKYRYGRDHLSYITLESKRIITQHLIKYGRKLSILNLSPACAMPDECKVGSVIDSYRNYYHMHKSHLFSWTKRNKPEWLSN